MYTDEILFFEAHAAAQSLKNTWTRLASTHGCIMIFLTRESLTIRPHWFAAWPIRLLRLDLSHEIPITNVMGITDLGKWRGLHKVEVRFVTPQGDGRILWLYLRKYAEFITHALRLMPGHG